MQLHLANGVVIKGDVYDHLMALPKNSRFVKRSQFGDLVNRSAGAMFLYRDTVQKDDG